MQELTTKKKTMCDMIMRKCGNTEIAAALDISRQTVDKWKKEPEVQAYIAELRGQDPANVEWDKLDEEQTKKLAEAAQTHLRSFGEKETDKAIKAVRRALRESTEKDFSEGVNFFNQLLAAIEDESVTLNIKEKKQADKTPNEIIRELETFLMLYRQEHDEGKVIRRRRHIADLE